MVSKDLPGLRVHRAAGWTLSRGDTIRDQHAEHLMGLLVEGVWRDEWYDTAATGGKFEAGHFLS